MVLPTNWTSLSAAGAALRGHQPRADRPGPAAARRPWRAPSTRPPWPGADREQRPRPRGGFPWTQWGSNWAGAMGNPLEADLLLDVRRRAGLVQHRLPAAPGTAGLLGAPRQRPARPEPASPVRWARASIPPDTRATRAGPSSSSTRRVAPAVDYSWSQVTPYLPGNGRRCRAHGAGRRDRLHARRRAATGWPRPTAGSSASATPPSTTRWPASTWPGPIVGIAATPDGRGYWLVAVRRRDLRLRRRRLLRLDGRPPARPAGGRDRPHARRPRLLGSGLRRRHLRLRRRRASTAPWAATR